MIVGPIVVDGYLIDSAIRVRAVSITRTPI